MNITILDGYTVTQEDLNWHDVTRLPNVEVTVYERTSPELTVERLTEADAVLTNKVVFDRKSIAALPRLKYIGVLATGYNVVDIEAARERGIVVTNIPAYSTPSVAQMVFAHLLNVTNAVAHYAKENRRGRWTESPDFLWMDQSPMELAGKQMGIRGMGNIGTEVARIALAFGMKVVCCTHRPVSELPLGAEKMEWEQMLASSDIVSLHCPLTEATLHLIDRGALQKMKKGAILINTGRGPLVDDAAVAQALKGGHLGAYCADVLSEEPSKADNPLLSAPRCHLTPHIGWASSEARNRLIHIAAENLRTFIEGHPQNVVS
mgnify:FL=1